MDVVQNIAEVEIPIIKLLAKFLRGEPLSEELLEKVVVYIEGE